MNKIVKVNKRGFTLVEMMLVVAIIIVLSGVAILSIGTAIRNSKEKQDKYQSSYIPAVDDRAESVRGIMRTSRAPRKP